MSNGPDALLERLALALLSLAENAGMPDTYWQTDSRVKLAREVLGIPADRYAPDFVRMMDKYDEERVLRP